MDIDANAIFIKTKYSVSDEDILKKLSLSFVKGRNSTLEKQIRTQTKFSIGEYKDIKIICHQEMPLLGIGAKEKSDFEKTMSSLFKDSTLLSIGLQSTALVYGYSLIENGQKSRVNCGSIEGKLFEYGKVTDEESMVYSKYVYDTDKKMFFSKEQKYYVEEYVFGQDLILSLLNKLFQENFDAIDLETVKMRTYNIRKMTLLEKVKTFLLK